MINSIGAEKTCDKVQPLSMIKAMKKLRIEETELEQ